MNGSWTFKPGANDRNIDLQNATSQVVARLRADTGGDGRLFVEDRNSATRFMAHAPTTGGALYIDGDETTGKRIAPALQFGPFGLAGTGGVTVTGIPAGAQALAIPFRHVRRSDTGSFEVQLGTGAGLQTSGYVASSGATINGASGAVVSINSGLVYRMGLAGSSAFGMMQLAHVGSGNCWSAMHGGEFAGNAIAGGGTVCLTGALTQLRVHGANFNDGFFNVVVRF